jgi:serine/threonine protein kinase
MILEITGYLHKREIKQRELKSDNVLRNAEGIQKIADFETSGKISNFSYLSITLKYMLPKVQFSQLFKIIIFNINLMIYVSLIRLE